MAELEPSQRPFTVVVKAIPLPKDVARFLEENYASLQLYLSGNNQQNVAVEDGPIQDASLSSETSASDMKFSPEQVVEQFVKLMAAAGPKWAHFIDRFVARSRNRLPFQHMFVEYGR